MKIQFVEVTSQPAFDSTTCDGIGLLSLWFHKSQVNLYVKEKCNCKIASCILTGVMKVLLLVVDSMISSVASIGCFDCNAVQNVVVQW